MSQERPQEDDQRQPQDAATPRPQASSPDMLPPGAYGAGSVNNPQYFGGLPSFLPVYTQNSLGEWPSSGYASFPNFAIPFLQPYGNMSPPQPVRPARSSFGNGKAVPEQEFNSPAENAQQPPGHGSPPRVQPAYQVYPGQGHKRSRLPSTDVGRKAPRKAVASSPLQESPPRPSHTKSTSARDGAPNRKNQDRHDSPVPVQGKPTAKSRARRLATPMPSGFRKLPPSEYGLRPPRVRGGPVVLEEDPENDDNEEDSPRATIESNEDALLHSPPSASTTRNQARRGRPRPQYDYWIPKELEGVQRALGEDNWNDYLVLHEKKWMGNITEAQYTARTRAIFTVFDETARENMEKKMVDRVVRPVLEKHAGSRVELLGASRLDPTRQRTSKQYDDDSA